MLDKYTKPEADIVFKFPPRQQTVHFAALHRATRPIRRNWLPETRPSLAKSVLPSLCLGLKLVNFGGSSFLKERVP